MLFYLNTLALYNQQLPDLVHVFPQTRHVRSIKIPYNIGAGMKANRLLIIRLNPNETGLSLSFTLLK